MGSMGGSRLEASPRSLRWALVAAAVLGTLGLLHWRRSLPHCHGEISEACPPPNAGPSKEVNSVVEMVYRRLVTDEPRPCDTPRPSTFTPPCIPLYNRSVLIANMFAHEVDLLEIALHEYQGLADVVLTENLQVHNVGASTEKPFYMWPALAKTARFRELARGVEFVSCTPLGDRASLWDAESNDDNCMSDAVVKRAARYDIAIVGSIDEVLSRRNIYRLKHCELPSLPSGAQIGMPLGFLGEHQLAFRTDHNYPSNKYSLSLPTIYSTTWAETPGPRTWSSWAHTVLYGKRAPGTGDFLKWHRVAYDRPESRPGIIGGVHLSGYAFAHNTILKELWCSECTGEFSREPYCSLSPKTRQDQTALAWQNDHPERFRTHIGAEFEMPVRLQQCPDRFPAWFGEVDQREKLLLRHLCGRNSSTTTLPERVPP
eukprot:m.366205 g.366205  ORF g.366205 m.366205 type:complete len:429 (+) comp28092_c0_seq15:44-1330(+)